MIYSAVVAATLNRNRMERDRQNAARLQARRYRDSHGSAPRSYFDFSRSIFNERNQYDLDFDDYEPRDTNASNSTPNLEDMFSSYRRARARRANANLHHASSQHSRQHTQFSDYDEENLETLFTLYRIHRQLFNMPVQYELELESDNRRNRDAQLQLQQDDELCLHSMFKCERAMFRKIVAVVSFDMPTSFVFNLIGRGAVLSLQWIILLLITIFSNNKTQFALAFLMLFLCPMLFISYYLIFLTLKSHPHYIQNAIQSQNPQRQRRNNANGENDLNNSNNNMGI
jgi:hypothetical protein